MKSNPKKPNQKKLTKVKSNPEGINPMKLKEWKSPWARYYMRILPEETKPEQAGRFLVIKQIIELSSPLPPPKKRSKCSKFLWHCLAPLCPGPLFCASCQSMRWLGGVLTEWSMGLLLSLEYLLPKGGEVMPLSLFRAGKLHDKPNPNDLESNQNNDKRVCGLGVMISW